MFSLLKKKVASNALVAVCPSAQGLGLARVRREADLPPVLEICEFFPCAVKDQTAQLVRLCKDYDLDGYQCLTVMDLGSYNLPLVEAPDVQSSELRAAIRWRIKDLIDFHVDDAVIDVFEVPNQKAAGRNTMMYAVVARTSAVKQRIDRLTQADINLQIVDIPELALRNLATLLPEDVGGVATLYLQQDAGLITVTRQSTMYLSRRIDVGTAGLIGIDPEQRQRRLDSIIVEIQRTLDYYESHFSQPAVSNVVITPVTDELNDIASYLNQQLDMQVREMDLNQLVDLPEAMDKEQQANCLLAVGAALRQEAKSL